MSDVLGQIRIGWRALSGFSTNRELQTISAVANYSVKIRAGRIAESGLEIVLFRFSIDDWPSPRGLPHGKGFDLGLYDIEGEKYLGLSRASDGALELFEAMLSNVIDHALNGADLSHKVLFRKFLDRVRDWQTFMSRGRNGLSRQDEIGLVGELCILKNLLSVNLPSENVIDWWKGPLHGTHDFHLNGGAIEVKATTSQDGFLVDIFDVSQLDPATVTKLFVFGVRLEVSESGHSLPELVDDIRFILIDSTSALSLFDKCLSYAGYRDENAKNYTSKYGISEILGFEVTDEFPSLRRSSLPSEVLEVKYRLDLDAMTLTQITETDALKLLGVIFNGAV